MQRHVPHTRATTRCLACFTLELEWSPSQVGKLATQKSLYTWFTAKLL